MTTISEMNPSTVTVNNPAETPGQPDVTPAGPSTVIAEKTKDAGCCDTSAKSEAKPHTDSCVSTDKPQAAPGAAETCASGEKAEKPAGSCAV